MQLEINFPGIDISKGNTLLFLDEIQACPNARVALKTFAMDRTIDVIASGSLLGLYYKEVRSYPVGYERPVDMYALDFEEFLWAIGISKDIISELRKAFINKTQINESILEKMQEYFNMYVIVGGMPAVVNKYIETQSLSRVLVKQREIIDEYRFDILKYAPARDRQKILVTFDSIPSQLSKKKKFKYSDIDISSDSASERKYMSSIQWLKDAGIVNLCYNLSEPALPLNSNRRLESFKVYMRDTGLLVSLMENGVQKALLNKDLYINEGGIIESVCASEIKTRFDSITYFEKKSKLEIDFILNIEGEAVALEVKSGNNKQAKSLQSIISNYKTVTRYIKLEYNTNIYIDENNIEHYPLFMIMFI